jgi:Uma2 family endonuclease
VQQTVDQLGLDPPDLPTRFETVEAFAAAFDGCEGHYELVDGAVVAVSPETVGHSLVNTRIGLALSQAIADRGAPLLVAIGGPTLKIAPRKGRKPDVVVFRADAVTMGDVVATAPVLVVEVISAASVRLDTVRKLAEYVTLPSLTTYLIVDPDDRLVTVHRRRPDGIATSIHDGGVLDIADLGVAIDLGTIWPT